jgi:hypothetical protein
VLLWADDVDIFAIVDNLAQEGYILKGEDGKVLLLNVIAKDVSGLQVKPTLTEDGADIGTLLQVRLDLLENVDLRLGWGADDDHL